MGGARLDMAAFNQSEAYDYGTSPHQYLQYEVSHPQYPLIGEINMIGAYETEASWLTQQQDYAQLTSEEQILFQQQLQQEYDLQSRQTLTGLGGDRPLTEGHHQYGGHGSSRLAGKALASWKMTEKISQRPSISSRLNLTSRGSTTDLKDFLYSRGKSKISGIHLAAAKGDVNMITTIIRKEGPNVQLNTLDENESIPLMYAVLADSLPAVEMLLQCGAKREMTDSNQRTAVHYAAFFGKAKVLKFLIESAAKWLPRDTYGRTPLHWSAANKDVKCLQVLIRHAGIVMGDINVRDYEGMSPLHCAAQYCKPRHVQVLYEADCDFAITDIEGKTALHWTAENPDPSCIEALVYCFPSLLNVRDMYGQTILHMTAKLGAIHLVETLLKNEGIEIDAKDKNEQTPLHVAAVAGQPGPVQLLLLHNALDSCIDISGLTALHHAVLANSSHCVQQLVLDTPTPSSVTHIPSADDKSQTPLMLAASNGQTNIIEILASNEEIKRTINNTDPQGRSALHMACEAGADDSIAVLIYQGADPNLMDKAKVTPLMLTCTIGNANCVKPLIDGGADVLKADAEGYSCLHVSIINGHLAVIEQLIASGGVKIEALDNSGNTPLQLAISLNSAEDIVEMLLDIGASPDTINMEGLTGLHIAGSLGNLEILRLLLGKGNGFVNNMDGTPNRYTPLDYAQQNNHTECVDLLVQHGGITIADIRDIASTSIQTAYKSYRAKKLLETLKREKKAAIVIQRHVKGFIKRQWYTRTVTHIKAAIRIQALVRGFVQKRKFKRMLDEHFIREDRQETIEKFASLIQSLKDDQVINPISLSVPQPAIVSQDNAKAKAKTDERTRKERSLRMRELYLEKQRNWERFRQAEKQRRIDKAHKEKMDYLNRILQGKNKRRVFHTEQFQYSNDVRLHFLAAGVIQRAYREYKERQGWWERVAKAKLVREKTRKNFAASIIQNQWRRYSEWKKFDSKYMQSVHTSPVVQVTGNRSLLPHHQFGWIPANAGRGNPSYKRPTLTSGIGRRKVHQTQPGGFKIFRPLPTFPATPISSAHIMKGSLWSSQRVGVDTGQHRQIIQMKKRNRTNRLENMKAQWPWAEYLLQMTANGNRSIEEINTAIESSNNTAGNAGSSCNNNNTTITHSVTSEIANIKLPRIT